jgi:hypothetical protein
MRNCLGPCDAAQSSGLALQFTLARSFVAQSSNSSDVLITKGTRLTPRCSILKRAAFTARALLRNNLRVLEAKRPCRMWSMLNPIAACIWKPGPKIPTNYVITCTYKAGGAAALPHRASHIHDLQNTTALQWATNHLFLSPVPSFRSLEPGFLALGQRLSAKHFAFYSADQSIMEALKPHWETVWRWNHG